MSSMRTAEVVDDSSATGSPPPPGSLCDDSETALSALALIDLHLETMDEKEVNEVSLEEGPGTGRKSRARISCKNAPFAYTDVRLRGLGTPNSDVNRRQRGRKALGAG